MKVTSQEASKMMKQYSDRLSYILNKESKSKEFLAALGEDPESVRPPYAYEETQKEIEEISAVIRKIKHTINIFNVTHCVPGFDMTIDEVLVYIPQLSRQRDKLWSMMNRLEKVRETASGSGKNLLIDYRYANYDIGKAKRDYELAAERLSKVQTALDLINSTVTMELEL